MLKDRKYTKGVGVRTRKNMAALLVLALLLAMGLLIAACGDDDADTTTTAEATETTAGGTETTAAPTDTTAADTETTEAAGPSGDPIVIGAIVSATGPGAPLGEPERNVLEMMQEQLNALGGVLGRPVEIVIEDDKSDPKEAVTAVNRLIDQEKAVAIIGSTISSSTLAIKEITAQKQIPQIAMAAANDITEVEPYEWIWRTPHKDALAVARALTYVSDELQLTKIAVLHDENAFGSSGAAEIEETAADYGLEIVATESYKTNETDLTAQLTKIKGANPEVIIVWGTNPGPALAAKNMQQLGMDIPYVGSHGIANMTFIDLAEGAAEGVVFPAGRLLVPSSITDPTQKEVTEGFASAYETEFGAPPNTFAGYAFEAVSLLVNALETAGGTDAAGIQAAMNATQNFPGPDGFYNYSETDHDGLKAEDMIMVRIQDGAWVLAE